MPIELIQTTRGRGQHGEQLDTALLDKAISKVLDLTLALDDASDNGKSVTAWLASQADSGNTKIEIEQVNEIIQKIYRELTDVHTTLIAARTKNKV